MTAASPTRTTLTEAHRTAAQACGQIVLILESGRGLNVVTIKDTIEKLNAAADILVTLIPAKTKE